MASGLNPYLRDSRKVRGAAVVLLAAGIGAVLGDFYIKPTLEGILVKRKRKR